MRLITIGPSHYCDKARLALELAKLPYTEEAHLPILHTPFVWRAGGRRSTPTLATDQGVFDDSTDIMRFVHEHPQSQWRPYLSDEVRAKAALELEERFDDILGPASRRIAYYHLLPHKALSMQVMADSGAPGWELRLLGLSYPLATWMLSRGLNIHVASVARSLERARQVFDEVDALLADGRAYLVGDHLSAADVTFIALAAPLLNPPQYPISLPLDQPQLSTMRALVEECRARASGRWALALYAQLRPSLAPHDPMSVDEVERSSH